MTLAPLAPSCFGIPFRVQKNGWFSPALCLTFGIWMYGWQLGIATGLLLLTSLLMHEAGHMAAATALGVPVREFGLAKVGAYNRRAFAACRRDEILITAAGPLMNLLLAVPFAFVPQIGPEIALCNLILGIVNLVPLPSSDGLRILRNLMGSTAARPIVVTPKPELA